MMKKKIIALCAVAAAVLLAATVLWQRHTATMKAEQEAQYRENHIFVEDAVYPKDAKQLDLRGTGISIQHYESIRSQLPECHILWDVPFQGVTYPSNTESLTLTTLSDEDVNRLDYLTQLKTVDAMNCTDYPQLMKLQARHSGCSISYQLSLGDEIYSNSTTALTFSDADPAELLEKLQYLTQLQTVHFIQPAFEANHLLKLRETYPNVAFTWEKDVLGTTYRDDVTELDFSGIQMESVEQIEADMAYFPSLEKLVMIDCGIDGETMAAFRERARGSYKVVWAIHIQSLTIRTDIEAFAPIKYGIYVTDIHMGEFHYLEDLVCLDLGHKGIKNIDFIWKMPRLKYLILADTEVSDITPIGSLKELEYLELFKTKVTDYSPLLGCTALEDVNLACTKGDASVFAQMPWLKNLWINQCGVDQQTRELLIKSLPDTQIEFDHTWHLGNSWRGLPNYFKIRDILGMPYYDWGNEVGRPGDPGYPYEVENP